MDKVRREEARKEQEEMERNERERMRVERLREREERVLQREEVSRLSIFLDGSCEPRTTGH
jgi:hypothetical protein